MRTCEVDECDRKHVAKGMCGTHYNKAKYPAEVRHRKIPHVCDCCGGTFEREGRAARYANTYCSYLCRDYAKGSTLTCKLPADHWVYMFGASSEWKPKVPASFNCAWCEKPGVRSRTQRTFCAKACAVRAKRASRRGREFNAPGAFTWAELVRLWVAFDKACAYCAKPTSLSNIQAEHVHPLSKGGRNDLSNLLPSCGPCNSDKRDLLLPDWALDRGRRALPAVTTTWDDNDPRFRHLVTPTSLLQAA